MDISDQQIGRRVREVRAWRRQSQAAVAGLAGITPAYLSMIERGLRPVTKRSVLEALASALRVAPGELTGQPYVPSDAATNEAHAALVALDAAVTGWCPGEVPEVPARAWQEIEADLVRLKDFRFYSDYAGQGALLPGLIADLLVAAANPEFRRAALVGLIEAYHSVANMAGRIGARGLPTLAAERAQRAAEELDEASWLAHTAWARTQMLGTTGRQRQYTLAIDVADAEHARLETRGMAHLTAAMAASAQGKADVAEVHLREAVDFADRLGLDVSPFGTVQFGKVNVGIWRVAIGVELGDGGKVAEIAKGMRLAAISPGRQATFWTDYGRGLAAERKTRDQGLAAVLKAEQLAPQQVRNNPFVRELVTDLLGKAQRDAGGRELRGLAWRLGVAPTG